MGDSRNLKANYRRAQAHKRLGNTEQALRDVKIAASVDPNDSTVAAFKEELEKELGEDWVDVSNEANETAVVVEAPVEAKVKTESLKREDLEAKSAKELKKMMKERGLNSASCTEKGDMVDLILENPDCVAKTTAPTSSNMASTGTAGMPSQADIDRMQAQMKQNPGMMKDAASKMANMSPAELEMMNARLPEGQKMSPDMARMAGDMMKNMSPEQLEQYQKMAQSMQANGGSMPGGMSPSSGMAPNQADAMKAMQDNPEMMKNATEMMKNMSDEDLARMPGVPKGTTPEMMRMASEMMSGMSAEEVAAMQKSAAAMQGAGVGPGGQPDASAVSKMMEDPEMMKSMQKMMGNMSPEMAAQMGMTPEQAKQASDQMSKMDPETLQTVMKYGMKAKAGWDYVKTQRFWMQALIVVFIAMVIGHVTGTF